MSMSRWNPWGEMMSLRDAMDDLLRESFVVPRVIGSGTTTSGVAVDVREMNDDFLVKAVLPGVKPNDVHVQVKGETLTISGEFKEDEEERGPGQGQTGQAQAQAQSQSQSQIQAQSQQGQQGQQSQGQGQTASQRSQWLVRERRFGRFQRTITLPTPVQADQAQASFEHGILTIKLPKAQEARARSIPIQTGGGQSQQAIEAQGQVQGQSQSQGHGQGQEQSGGQTHGQG